MPEPTLSVVPGTEDAADSTTEQDPGTTTDLENLEDDEPWPDELGDGLPGDEGDEGDAHDEGGEEAADTETEDYLGYASKEEAQAALADLQAYRERTEREIQAAYERQRQQQTQVDQRQQSEQFGKQIEEYGQYCEALCDQIDFTSQESAKKGMANALKQISLNLGQQLMKEIKGLENGLGQRDAMANMVHILQNDPQYADVKDSWETICRLTSRGYAPQEAVDEVRGWLKKTRQTKPTPKPGAPRRRPPKGVRPGGTPKRGGKPPEDYDMASILKEFGGIPDD